MKQKNLKCKISLIEERSAVYSEKAQLLKSTKKGHFLKVVLLKRDPLTLKGYFEEVKGFCIGKSKKGGVLKMGNVIKQVRFFYSFHPKSICVKAIRNLPDFNLPERALKKKRLILC